MYIVIRLRYETELTEKYRSEGVNVLFLNECNAISEYLFNWSYRRNVTRSSPSYFALTRKADFFLFCLIFRWREVGHTLGFGSRKNEWAITTVK